MSDFKGFESDRYKQHDAIIKKLVAEFNKDKAKFIDCSTEQAKGIADLSEALVKSWAIQESGGNDTRSLAAWAKDPLQVNVPGDWSDYKTSTGLKKPTHRNEGTAEQNIRAAISWLARKGFGKSGQPPKNRAAAVFDGWQVALQRYNGRSALTSNGQKYRDNYAKQIITRAENPGKHIEIQLPKPV